MNLDKHNLASARFSGIGRRISRPHIATWGSDNALLGFTHIMMRWWVYTKYIQNIYRKYLILKCFCNVTLPTLSLFLFWCYSDFDQTENKLGLGYRVFIKWALTLALWEKKKGRLPSRRTTIKKRDYYYQKRLLKKGLLSKNQMVNKAQSLSLLVCLSALLLLNVLRPSS